MLSIHLAVWQVMLPCTSLSPSIFTLPFSTHTCAGKQQASRRERQLIAQMNNTGPNGYNDMPCAALVMFAYGPCLLPARPLEHDLYCSLPCQSFHSPACFHPICLTSVLCCYSPFVFFLSLRFFHLAFSILQRLQVTMSMDNFVMLLLLSADDAHLTPWWVTGAALPRPLPCPHHANQTRET